MCIAVPGKIVGLLNNEAKADIMGVETIINVQLIDSPQIGDYVLIHTGCAIEKIDKAYFNDISNLFEDILSKDEEDYE